MHTPLFMFGLDRSGTTLLSMLIGAHPEIAVPLSVTGMWYQMVPEEQVVEPSDNQIEDFVDKILVHPRINLWDKEISKDKVFERISSNSYQSVLVAFHQEYARQCGKKYWANIDIATLDNMHIANTWFPSAKFLHIVRDGRDVAISHHDYAYGFGNLYDCAKHWNNRVLRNIRMGQMLPENRYQIVKYEQLVQEPENTLKTICDFIEIEYSGEMLDYRSAVEAKVPESKMFLWPMLKEPPNPSKVGRWKKEMSSSERVVFEREARGLLRMLDYETFDPMPNSLLAHILELYYFLGQEHRFTRLLDKIKTLVKKDKE